MLSQRLLARVQSQRRGARVRTAEGAAATSTVVSSHLSTVNEPTSPANCQRARPSTARRAFSTNGLPFFARLPTAKSSPAPHGAIHLARAAEENFEVLYRLPVSMHAEGVQAQLSHAVKVGAHADEQHTACASAVRQHHAHACVRTRVNARQDTTRSAACGCWL